MNDADGQTPDSTGGETVMEFRNPYKIGLYVTVALGVSVFALVLGTVTVFLTLLSNKPNTMMPALAGLQGMAVFMGVSFAVCLLRVPVRVILAPRHLTLEWLIRRRSLPWNEIIEIKLKQSDFPEKLLGSFAGRKDLPKEHLVLLGANGRKIAEISGSMEHFSLLVQEIHRRSSLARATATFDLDKHTSRLKAAQKSQRRVMLVVGFLFAAFGITIAVTSFVIGRNKYLLDKQGRVAQAAVTRHYIHNITPRIEYKFTAGDGRTYSKNVMVERRYWETLEENGSVAVKYLPSNPKSNKLVSGQVEDMGAPLPLIILGSVVMTGIGLFSIAIYFLGISDIKFEKGRFRLVRTDHVEESALAEALLEETEELYVAHDLTAPELQGRCNARPASVPIEPSMISSRRRLPAGLKAIGILNIVFGSLGVLWNAGRLILALVLVRTEIVSAEDLEAGMPWLLGAHAVAALMAFLLGLSGIGILAFRNWGRILATVAASARLVLGTIELISICLPVAEITDPQERFIFNLSRGFYVFWVLLTMVYPTVVVVLLNRKSTREVFRRPRQAEDPTDMLMPAP